MGNSQGDEIHDSKCGINLKVASKRHPQNDSVDNHLKKNTKVEPSGELSKHHESDTIKQTLCTDMEKLSLANPRSTENIKPSSRKDFFATNAVIAKLQFVITSGEIVTVEIRENDDPAMVCQNLSKSYALSRDKLLALRSRIQKDLDQYK